MRILVIGEIVNQLVIATQMAIKRGAKIRQVNNIELALDSLRSGNGADLILADVKLEIKALTEQLKQEHIAIPIIAYGFNVSKNEVTDAIEQGAHDYLPLPPNEELIATMLTTISNNNINFIAESDKMKQVVELAKKVAISNATVLITGESGTGKEVMARFIHSQSKIADRSFIALNCAAIPDNLLESELFGHEKGAFTGAIARRIGKFEEANGGTLLLDEISEIDVKLQTKLLRAIQEKEISRIGGNGTIKVEVRIIATSNRNLVEEIKKGNFREDLYYRLNVINITLPALRERKSDIINIANHYISKYATQNGLNTPILTESTQEIMLKYDWPGNVRELENAMYRAVLLSDQKTINPNDLMLDTYAIYNNDKNQVKEALDAALGNRIEAAKILGVSLKILQQKIEEYQLAN